MYLHRSDTCRIRNQSFADEKTNGKTFQVRRGDLEGGDLDPVEDKGDGIFNTHLHRGWLHRILPDRHDPVVKGHGSVRTRSGIFTGHPLVTSLLSRN
jgi:hypothetical protein